MPSESCPSTPSLVLGGRRKLIFPGSEPHDDKSCSPPLFDSAQDWILQFDSHVLKHPRGRTRGCRCDMCSVCRRDIEEERDRVFGRRRQSCRKEDEEEEGGERQQGRVVGFTQIPSSSASSRMQWV